jgi:DNA sulfur modification protein DndD
MQFLKLSVRNWGVFRDLADFSLEPAATSDDSKLHLTVFSGHNGAGKSTLFQAMQLALHGSLALGDRVSQRDYDKFLMSRLHRHTEGRKSHLSDDSGITLSFRYVQSGRPLNIRVERELHRSGDNIRENLSLFQNDESPEVESADYQTWLNDLVPPGLASLCFFDGERLDALANPERHNGVLGEILRRLLGLDLVGRLQDDLTYYIRHHGSKDATRDLRKKVLQEQASLDKLDAQLEKLENELKSLNLERSDLEANLGREERRLAAEGGTYAERRPELKERLQYVQEEIEYIIDQLHEMSAGLLPFSLAPELCKKLNHRLKVERDVRRRRAAKESWQERVDHIQKAVHGEKLWEDLDLSSAARQSLSQRLTQMLREESATFEDVDEQSLLHHFALLEEEQLQVWITTALGAIPRQVQMLGNRLEQLRKRRHHIEETLSRAPDDEILAPIHENISRIESELAELQKREKELNESIGSLQFQRDEQIRELQRADERLRDAQANQREIRLAERSQLALKAYEDALIRQRLRILEDRLVDAFNTVCRKEHLLRDARIDANNLDVQLRGTDGHTLGLGDFSAGERQLYAMALLWSLRQVSGWQLPLVIDSPLARLDEVHRGRLIHDYLPNVSHQVILFVTDTELDENLMAQIEPYCARLYFLEYDPQSERTVVSSEVRTKPDDLFS